MSSLNFLINSGLGAWLFMSSRFLSSSGVGGIGNCFNSSINSGFRVGFDEIVRNRLKHVEYTSVNVWYVLKPSFNLIK